MIRIIDNKIGEIQFSNVSELVEYKNMLSGADEKSIEKPKKEKLKVENEEGKVSYTHQLMDIAANIEKYLTGDKTSIRGIVKTQMHVKKRNLHTFVFNLGKLLKKNPLLDVFREYEGKNKGLYCRLKTITETNKEKVTRGDGFVYVGKDGTAIPKKFD